MARPPQTRRPSWPARRRAPVRAAEQSAECARLCRRRQRADRNRLAWGRKQPCHCLHFPCPQHLPTARWRAASGDACVTRRYHGAFRRRYARLRQTGHRRPVGPATSAMRETPLHSLREGLACVRCAVPAHPAHVVDVALIPNKRFRFAPRRATRASPPARAGGGRAGTAHAASAGRARIASQTGDAETQHLCAFVSHAPRARAAPQCSHLSTAARPAPAPTAAASARGAR
jgi:hypothetical protein